MKPLFPAMAIALALTGCASASEPPARSPKAEAALDKALAGRTPGKPQSCVSIIELKGNRIIDSNTILFDGSGGRIWRNDPPHGCPGLSQSRVIVTKSSLTSHCNGDIFQIMDQPTMMTVGSCSFGEFVPYTKNK